MARIGIFTCWCGENIARTVDVEEVTKRVGELTAPWAVHRGPTLSVPVGPHPASGMPVGMQLTGPVGADDAVCAAGAWLQERTPWHEQRPPSRR